MRTLKKIFRKTLVLLRAVVMRNHDIRRDDDETLQGHLRLKIRSNTTTSLIPAY